MKKVTCAGGLASNDLDVACYEITRKDFLLLKNLKVLIMFFYIFSCNILWYFLVGVLFSHRFTKE